LQVPASLKHVLLIEGDLLRGEELLLSIGRELRGRLLPTGRSKRIWCDVTQPLSGAARANLLGSPEDSRHLKTARRGAFFWAANARPILFGSGGEIDRQSFLPRAAYKRDPAQLIL